MPKIEFSEADKQRALGQMKEFHADLRTLVDSAERRRITPTIVLYVMAVMAAEVAARTKIKDGSEDMAQYVDRPDAMFIKTFERSLIDLEGALDGVRKQ